MAGRVLAGVPAAPGLAEGPAVRHREETARVPRRSSAEPTAERGRLTDARRAAREEIERLRREVASSAGTAEAAIFAAHLMFLDDPALLSMAESSIVAGTNAEAAWMDAVEHFVRQLEALPDATLRARAADVRDVGGRVLAHLTARRDPGLRLREPAVVVAEDLAPSALALLDRSRLLALCLGRSGATSHAAILARAWRIPAVVGLGEAVRAVRDGERVLVDGDRGRVIVEPDAAEAAEARARREQGVRRARLEEKDAQHPAVTSDGRHVRIEANVGSPEEASEAAGAGADGVGLLRTEFLFLDRDEAPGEEEQAAAYRAIVDRLPGLPVTARVLDAGGDKPLPYLPLRPAANPFLGYRGVRLLLDHPGLLKTQLRALLRADAGGTLRVMLPMVATLEELRRAQAVFDEVRLGLPGTGGGSPERRLGIMVEVPAAVVLADRFARKAAFFSIGTNDLTQYTMAADRGDAQVALLHDGCQPAVLRQIRQVADAARAAGISVSVCGELAGDPDAVPLLVGLGLDALSMSPSSIPRVKAIVRRWSSVSARRLAARALEMDSADAVRSLVRSASAAAE